MHKLLSGRKGGAALQSRLHWQFDDDVIVLWLSLSSFWTSEVMSEAKDEDVLPPFLGHGGLAELSQSVLRVNTIELGLIDTVSENQSLLHLPVPS